MQHIQLPDTQINEKENPQEMQYKNLKFINSFNSDDNSELKF